MLKKVILWVLLALVVVMLLAVGGIVVYAQLNTANPQPVALAAMQSTEAVEVSDGEWLVFTPKQSTPDTGFIFYPGGLVDPRAYAPYAQDIAAQGYLVVIVPMPLNLAVFGSNKATDVIAAYPEIENWVVGGHSLGGTMAARFAYQNPDSVDGLALWASYPADGNDLRQSNLQVTSIYGTRDGLVTSDNIESSRSLLPADSNFVAIEGGNHAQFGWYGPQDGDLPATINHLDQQAQTVAATVEVLNGIERE